MPFLIKVAPHTLYFNFAAGTSRGTLREKKIFYLQLRHTQLPHRIGIGECGPIEGLSPETLNDISPKLTSLSVALKKTDDLNFFLLPEWKYELSLQHYPSLIFAIEMACMGLCKENPYQLFLNTDHPEQAIPINGLIWMGQESFLREQIQEKLQQGYQCIKMKIGGDQTQQVLSIIRELRREYSAEKLMIRVDANGYFDVQRAIQLSKELKNLDVHSIEQPLAPGNIAHTKALISEKLCPVALDEELISYHLPEEKERFLQQVKPAYLVLKPSLHGGFSGCMEWIELCKKYNIGWWITSMLESNLGLNAIARFALHVNAKGYQGLGTGGLYTNNIHSPITIKHSGMLSFDSSKQWDESFWQKLNWQQVT